MSHYANIRKCRCKLRQFVYWLCTSVLLRNPGFQRMKNMFRPQFVRQHSNPEKANALVTAIRSHDLNLVKALLDDDMEINENILHSAPSPRKFYTRYLPPVMIAVMARSKEITKYLVKEGADINQVGREFGENSGHHMKFTPLMWACDERDLEMIDTIIALGGDVDKTLPFEQISGFYDQEDYSATCLHHAARFADYNIVKRLIRGGARVSVINTQHQMPLHFACVSHNYKITHALIGAGGLSNHMTLHRMTPLKILLGVLANMRPELMGFGRSFSNSLPDKHSVPKTIELFVAAGYDFSRDGWLEKDRENSQIKQCVDPQLWNWLIEQLQTPLTLKQLCRRSIRRCLCDSRVEEKVQRLEIPIVLKSYLLFDIV